eukprot:NODE_8613_length_662_cov_24.369202_g7988_i0.p1 GENE.NODE_8613_length_662_cov_24.369202_g7988_i0~~NODE_8613_length_662_cov_24.369202_g7988_i0.p1  ORF type:complete len:177 (-),score=20.92 NODE_8613_length_662_cov_24.369202_g7988_i0:75-605(-)
MNRFIVPSLKLGFNAARFSVKVGDRIPAVELHENTPASKVNIESLCQGKKVVIFGVPGAFTPGCSKTHLPGYVADYQSFKNKGVDEIVCVSVNDAFVMAEWGNAQNATGKIRMLADPRAEFAKALGTSIDLSGALGNVRTKRFSMVVNNGVIEKLNVEPDNTGLACSLAKPLLETL